MPRTPRNPTPPRLRQVPDDGWTCSGRSTPCVDGSHSKSNISTIERRASTRGVDLRVDQGDTHQERAMPFRQIAENCRRRGGSGCGGVRGMDAAAKPPRMGLRRPPQPDPPRHPTDSPLLLLLLLLLLRLPASGRHYRGCRAQPCRTPNLNSLFCVRSHPSVRLCGSAAAVRFPPGSPATGVRPIARPHSDAVRHAFQPALRVGCTQFSQRGSRERSESADQFDLPPSVRSDRR